MSASRSKPGSPIFEAPDLSRQDFLRIRELAKQKFGLELADGKETLVASRLSQQVRGGGFRSFNDYVQHVIGDRTGESLVHLIDALSTNHTSLFREKQHFDFLASHILPKHAGRDMLIWSAACSTGEEPYSIAISILEQPHRLQPRTFRIIASDISTRVLEKANAGIYGVERLQGIPPAMQTKYFQMASSRQEVVVRPEVRSCVEFRRMNLMERFDFLRPFDLIFCRNVMIYFSRATQQGLVNRLSNCLRPGGHLFVGHSESLTAIDHPLEYLSPAIYRRPQGGGQLGGRTS